VNRVTPTPLTPDPQNNPMRGLSTKPRPTKHPLSAPGGACRCQHTRTVHPTRNDSPPPRIDPTPAPPTRARQLGRGATTSPASRSDPPRAQVGLALPKTSPGNPRGSDLKATPHREPSIPPGTTLATTHSPIVPQPADTLEGQRVNPNPAQGTRKQPTRAGLSLSVSSPGTAPQKPRFPHAPQPSKPRGTRPRLGTLNPGPGSALPSTAQVPAPPR
jgi:hypothetical protein